VYSLEESYYVPLTLKVRSHAPSPWEWGYLYKLNIFEHDISLKGRYYEPFTLKVRIHAPSPWEWGYLYKVKIFLNMKFVSSFYLLFIYANKDSLIFTLYCELLCKITYVVIQITQLWPLGALLVGSYVLLYISPSMWILFLVCFEYFLTFQYYKILQLTL
jgi:hypothetical protein